MQDFKTDLSPTHSLDIDVDEISENEVNTVIRKLKSNKAAGLDNILAEYLKGGGNVVTYNNV